MLALLVVFLIVFALAFLSWWQQTHPKRSEPTEDNSPTITITSKEDGQIIFRMSVAQAQHFNTAHGDGCLICRGALGDGTVAILAPPHPQWSAVLAHPYCMQGLQATVTP